MKNYILLSVLLFSFQSFAAICSCDAHPSCGPRPGSCFQRIARDFLGKAFVEQRTSHPVTLTFSDKLTSTNTVHVGWGRNSDGMPFGTYYVVFTSENTFRLFLAPFGGQSPSLVEEFEFTLRYFPTQIVSLQTVDQNRYFKENK